MAAITTGELAIELNTTPRNLRKFLRSEESGIASVGKGSRYSIEKRNIRSLKTRFEKWESARIAAKNESNEDSAESTDD